MESVTSKAVPQSMILRALMLNNSMVCPGSVKMRISSFQVKTFLRRYASVFPFWSRKKNCGAKVKTFCRAMKRSCWKMAALIAGDAPPTVGDADAMAQDLQRVLTKRQDR